MGNSARDHKGGRSGGRYSRTESLLSGLLHREHRKRFGEICMGMRRRLKPMDGWMDGWMGGWVEAPPTDVFSLRHFNHNHSTYLRSLEGIYGPCDVFVAQNLRLSVHVSSFLGSYPGRPGRRSGDEPREVPAPHHPSILPASD